MDSRGIVFILIGIVVALRALQVFVRAWGFWVICLPIPFAWIFLIYAAIFV